MLVDIGIIAAGYLLGSIPFAYIITRLLTGKDIRVEGEGNVGGRNVGWVVGVPAGVLTSLLDAAKAALVCFLVLRFADWPGTIYAAGLAVMVGHGFPIWTSFIGGKGLACAVGYLALIMPWPILFFSFVVFLFVAFALKHFNFGVGCGVVTLLILTLRRSSGLPWPERLPQVGLSLMLFCFSGFKKLVDAHREQETRARSGWIENTGRHSAPSRPNSSSR